MWYSDITFFFHIYADKRVTTDCQTFPDYYFRKIKNIIDKKVKVYYY